MCSRVIIEYVIHCFCCMCILKHILLTELVAREKEIEIQPGFECGCLSKCVYALLFSVPMPELQRFSGKSLNRESPEFFSKKKKKVFILPW